MSPFSSDLVKMKVFTVVNLVNNYLHVLQYSHNTWFLDGMASVLISEFSKGFSKI